MQTSDGLQGWASAINITIKEFEGRENKAVTRPSARGLSASYTDGPNVGQLVSTKGYEKGCRYDENMPFWLLCAIDGIRPGGTRFDCTSATVRTSLRHSNVLYSALMRVDVTCRACLTRPAGL